MIARRVPEGTWPRNASAQGENSGDDVGDWDDNAMCPGLRGRLIPHAPRLGLIELDVLEKKASSLAVKSKTLVEVVSPGLEPGQAEPKTAVLPLHHETIRGSSYQW